MKINRQQIIGLLQDKGERHKSKEAERELPQKVDPDRPQDANILRRLGVDPTAMAKKFLGGKGISGL